MLLLESGKVNFKMTRAIRTRLSKKNSMPLPSYSTKTYIVLFILLKPWDLIFSGLNRKGKYAFDILLKSTTILNTCFKFKSSSQVLLRKNSKTVSEIIKTVLSNLAGAQCLSVRMKTFTRDPPARDCRYWSAAIIIITEHSPSWRHVLY